MVRFVLSIALAALTVLSVLSLDARLAGVRADDAADCVEGSGDTRLRGCSRIIKSGRVFGKRISKKDLATVHYNRGISYAIKGDFDRAIADYDKAIKLNPKDADVYYNRGNAYQRKGQHDRAIADYDKAIKLNPKYAEAHSNRGISYRKKDQYDRAIADYGAAIKLNPKLAVAYNNRGAAYYSKGL